MAHKNLVNILYLLNQHKLFSSHYSLLPSLTTTSTLISPFTAHPPLPLPAPPPPTHTYTPFTHQEADISTAAKSANQGLMSLVKSTEEDFDLNPLLQVRRYCHYHFLFLPLFSPTIFYSITCPLFAYYITILHRLYNNCNNRYSLRNFNRSM